MADIIPEPHWRDSARPPRFFGFDARAVFPFVLFLLHIRWWTFYLALAAVIFFVLLERYGYSIPVFMRRARCILAGKRKLSRPWWR